MLQHVHNFTLVINTELANFKFGFQIRLMRLGGNIDKLTITMKGSFTKYLITIIYS